MNIVSKPISVSIPLKLYNSVHIADATSRDGEGFYIFLGLNKEMVTQLKEYSLDKSDTDRQNNTSDRKRFGEGKYEDWYRKERTPFALVHKETNKLAALVWFGPKPLLSDGNNLQATAWRAYPLFRGKGIMKNFTAFAMDFYREKISGVKFWAVLKKENTGSAGLASSLGFQILPEKSDDASIVMIK